MYTTTRYGWLVNVEENSVTEFTSEYGNDSEEEDNHIVRTSLTEDLEIISATKPPKNYKIPKSHYIPKDWTTDPGFFEVFGRYGQELKFGEEGSSLKLRNDSKTVHVDLQIPSLESIQAYTKTINNRQFWIITCNSPTPFFMISTPE